jgi:hypothetical protein
MFWWTKKEPVRDYGVELGQVLVRLDGIDKRMRDLSMDWDSQYDKFRALYARLAKRQRREEVTENDNVDGVTVEAQMNEDIRRGLY